MNSENKEVLIAYIKEAQDLLARTNNQTSMPGFGDNTSEMEQIPGTDLWLKKGVYDDFAHRAYVFYKDYLTENNAFLAPGTKDETIAKETYNILSQEIREESNEYYNSKASELIDSNKDLINEYNETSKVLRNINERYAKLLDELNETKEALSKASAERRARLEENIRELEADSQMFLQSQKNVIANLAAIKSKINANFIAAAEEQKAIIERNYLQATRIPNPVYGKNGRPVLDGELKEYDALLDLIDIAKNVNLTNYTELVNDCLCINENQKDEVTELIAKTELFTKIKKPSYDLTVDGVNAKLIEQIKAELNRLEKNAGTKTKDLKTVTTTIKVLKKDAQNKSIIDKNGNLVYETEEYEIAKVLPTDYDEYMALFNMLRALNKVRMTYVQNLSNVWDLAYVDANDVSLFKTYFKNTNLFKQLDPKVKQIKQNDQLIAKLQKYLDEKVEAASQANEISNKNLDIRRINVGAIDILVQGDDYTECLYLANIITLLKDTENTLELKEVMGLAYVKEENAPKLEELIKSCKYFGYKAPQADITPNLEEQIAEKYNLILALSKKAEKANPSLIASNGLVLSADYDKYDSLLDQYIHLRLKKDGIKTEGLEYVKNYQKIRSEIEDNLKQTINITPNVDLTANDLKITELENKYQAFNKAHPSASLTQEEKDYSSNLTTLIFMLRTAKVTQDVEEIDGVYIPSGSADSYHKLINDISAYENKALGTNSFAATDAKIAELESKYQAFNKAHSSASLTPEEMVYAYSLTALINLLKDAKTNKNNEQIDNIYIPTGNVDNYNNLVNNISEYEKTYLVQPPLDERDFTLTDILIEGVQEKIDKWNDAHQDIENVMDSNEDYDYYNNLLEQLRILKSSKVSNNTTLINGVHIDVNKKDKYIELLDAIKEYEAQHQILDPNPTHAKIAELDDKLNSFPSSLTAKETEEYNLYESLKDLLEEGLSSKDVTPIDGLLIPKGKEDEYEDLKAKIANLGQAPTYPTKEATEKQIDFFKEVLKAPDFTMVEKVMASIDEVMLKILEDSLKATSWRIIDNLAIDEALADRYQELLDKAKELNEYNDNTLKKLEEIANIKASLTDPSELKDLYDELYNLLDSALTTKDEKIGYFDGIIIKEGTTKRYKEITAKINDIKARENLSDEIKEQLAEVEEEIARLKEECRDLDDSEIDPDMIKEQELLKLKKEILLRATGTTINPEDVPRYAEINAKLNELKDKKDKDNKDNNLPKAYLKAEEEMLAQMKPKRQKVTVRKVAKAVLGTIKESMKLIITEGLGIGAAYLISNVTPLAVLGSLGVTAALIKESRNKAPLTRNSDFGLNPTSHSSFYSTVSDHSLNYQALIDAELETTNHNIDKEIIADAEVNIDDAYLQKAAEEAKKNIEERFARLKPLNEQEPTSGQEPPAQDEEPPIVVTVPDSFDDILKNLESTESIAQKYKKIEELQKQLDSGTLSKEERAQVEAKIQELLLQRTTAILNNNEFNFALTSIYETYDKIKILQDRLGYASPEETPLIQEQINDLINSLISIPNITEIIDHSIEAKNANLEDLKNDPFRDDDDQEIITVNSDIAALKEIAALLNSYSSSRKY